MLPISCLHNRWQWYVRRCNVLCERKMEFYWTMIYIQLSEYIGIFVGKYKDKRAAVLLHMRGTIRLELNGLQPARHTQTEQTLWVVYSLQYRHMWSVCSQAQASRPRVCRSLNPANFHPEQILNSNFLLPLYCPQPYLNVGELRKYNYIWKLKTTWDLLLYFLFSILFFITPRNYLFYITCFIRFISRIRIYLFKFQSYLQNLWIQEVVFSHSKWANPE